MYRNFQPQLTGARMSDVRLRDLQCQMEDHTYREAAS
jgi:hypothetical protein